MSQIVQDVHRLASNRPENFGDCALRLSVSCIATNSMRALTTFLPHRPQSQQRALVPTATRQLHQRAA